MILPAQVLRKLHFIEPFCERTKHNGLTFGLSPAGYDVRIAETLEMHPGDFKLASTMEHFSMPHDVLGIVHDKSTWVRLGLAVQNTVLDPGWAGYLTLELTNHYINRLLLRAGDPIAQIVFHRLEDATEHPYAGKYMDQKAGAQPALREPESWDDNPSPGPNLGYQS